MLASFADPEIRRWCPRPQPTTDAAERYIAEMAAGWASGRRLTWAVCETTTGEMLGEVALAVPDPSANRGELSCWVLPAARGRGLATGAAQAVLRFSFAGLGLAHVACSWADGNSAAERVARACGFVPEDRLRAAWNVDGRWVDVVVAGLAAGTALTTTGRPA